MINEVVSCTNCQHENICKWRSEFERVKTEASDIELDPRYNTPIKVKVECETFNKKAQRQDGFFNQKRQL